MGSAAIRAGRAFVEFFGDDNPLKKVMDRVAGRLKAMGRAITGLGQQLFAAGSIGVAGFVGALKIFAETGSQLDEMSKRTGAAVESLSTLSYAAERSGASAEDLETGIRKMQKQIQSAAGGSKEAKAAFAQLGVSVDDLKNLKPEDAFRLIEDSLAGIPDPTEKAALAMQVFGKGGAALLPMAKDFHELEDRAKSLGLQMSGADAAAAVEFSNSLKDLWGILKMAAVQVGSGLSQELGGLISWLTQGASAVLAFVREHKGLIVTIAAVVAGLAVAGGALVVVGTAITAAGTALAALGGFLGVLLNPVTLLVVGLGAVVAYLVSISGISFDDILTGIAFVYVAFTHWQDILALLPTLGAAVITTIVNRISWMWENLKAFASWFGENWYGILSRTLQNGVTLFTNFSRLVGTIIALMWAKLLHPRLKFNTAEILGPMMDLTRGMKAIVEGEGPKSVAYEASDAEKELWGQVKEEAQPLLDEAAELGQAWKSKLAGLLGGQTGHEAKAALPDPGDVSQMVNKLSTRGSFNPFAAAGLSGGDKISEVAKNTGDTLKEIKGLRKDVKGSGGLVAE